MPTDDIIYLGHEDEETQSVVRFNIRGVIWSYLVDAMAVEAINGMARFAPGRALQMAKRTRSKEWSNKKLVKKRNPQQPDLPFEARELLAVARHVLGEEV